MHFLALKRKREAVGGGNEGEGEDGMDVDENENSEASDVKRARREGLPSVTETLRALVRQTTAVR